MGTSNPVSAYRGSHTTKANLSIYVHTYTAELKIIQTSKLGLLAS